MILYGDVMMKQFFYRTLELPELRLFLEYWYVWIPVAIVLIYVNHLLSNKIRRKQK
mgnify:CR=1 FL=1